MSTEDLETQVRAIRDRRAAAIRARVRAEHERDSAQAQADKNREQLLREFGVSTGAEARAKLAELEKELSDAVAAVKAELSELGV